MLLTWLSFWRDVLLAASGAAESGGVACSNLDWLPQVQAQAERLTLAQAQGIVCRVQETMELINRNVNTRLALEVLMLDLPHPMDR
jgi:DNA polymerase-3 subunit delta'